MGKKSRMKAAKGKQKNNTASQSSNQQISKVVSSTTQLGDRLQSAASPMQSVHHHSHLDVQDNRADLTRFASIAGVIFLTVAIIFVVDTNNEWVRNFGLTLLGAK